MLKIPFAALVQRFLHGNYGNMAVSDILGLFFKEVY